MGSKGSRIVKVNGDLKQAVENYLKDKENEIVEFFDKSVVRHSIPNKQTLLNPDKPIIKKYLLNDDNIMIEIYNYPALLRSEYGFFNLINECSAIIKFFFQSCSDSEKKEKFPLFFDSLIKQDNQKISEMTGLELNEENLIGLKKGLDKLDEYFGKSNLQNYYTSKKTKNDKKNDIDSSTFNTLYTIGKSIIFYLINYVFGRKEETILKEDDAIVKFFETMDTTLNSDEVLKNKNLFVIALEKTKNKEVTEICMFPYLMGQLNEYICPIIDRDRDAPSTNERYYYYLLKGIQFYKQKYERKKDDDFSNEWKEDMRFLKTATNEELIKFIEKKNEDKVDDADAVKSGQNSPNNFQNTHNGAIQNQQDLVFQNRHNGVIQNQQNFNFQNTHNSVIQNQQNFNFQNRHNGVMQNQKNFNFQNTHNSVIQNQKNFNFQNTHNSVIQNQQHLVFPNAHDAVIQNQQDLVFPNAHDAVIHIHKDNSNLKKPISG